MRPRAVVALSAGVATIVVAYATLAPASLPRLSRMRDERAALAAQAAALEIENSRTREVARALKGDDPRSLLLLEKVVRDELGYVRADEVVLAPRAPRPPKPLGERAEPPPP